MVRLGGSAKFGGGDLGGGGACRGGAAGAGGPSGWVLPAVVGRDCERANFSVVPFEFSVFLAAKK